MDLHNNAIGRAYAKRGVRRQELLDRLLSDPSVTRSP